MKRASEESFTVTEFDNIDDISTPTKVAKVHGYLVNLSPMRKSSSNNSYFDGEVRDSSGKAHIVGFDEKQYKMLSTLKQEKEAITFEGCKVKKSRYAGYKIDL